MSVVINEFQVVAESMPESTTGPVVNEKAPLRPKMTLSEIDEVLRLRDERQRRVRAD